LVWFRPYDVHSSLVYGLRPTTTTIYIPFVPAGRPHNYVRAETTEVRDIKEDRKMKQSTWQDIAAVLD
jgi:hypothetical protein